MFDSTHLMTYGSLTAFAFCLLSALLVIKRQYAAKKLEMERIMALRHKIDAVLKDGFDHSSREAFNTVLRTASLTTGLQAPRLQNLAKVDKPAPEKYKILGKLASQGMGAEEIASILGISIIEAGQLLSLSNMVKFGR